jgi:hypothetical protein
VVIEVADDDLLQPSSLLRNRLMHAPSQFLFDGLQLCLHAIPAGLPSYLEVAPTSFATDKGEAQESEGVRFAEPLAENRSGVGSPRQQLVGLTTTWPWLKTALPSPNLLPLSIQTASGP